MRDIIILAVIVLLVAILGIVLGFSSSPNVNDVTNNTTFNVSSGGPIPLSVLINDVKTEEWYRGYDNETVNWMESLGDKYAWVSSEGYVIMDKSDSNKIPSIYATDVDYWEIFSADVLEKHSLGNVENPREIVLVKNVKYIGEEAYYYDV
ncbi:hypothetical protein [Methanobrevibacter sp.]|uniref:hypothetical protein n=1 Tax=Methanobrevibacter sp. TaxID=66852 RepID=UPI00388F5A11